MPDGRALGKPTDRSARGSGSTQSSCAALLVPALVSLFGRWIWWMPKPVRRMLCLSPGADPTDPAARDP